MFLISTTLSSTSLIQFLSWHQNICHTIISSMGVTTFTQEITTKVSPARMFKALILDIHLVPKIMPQFIKSIEFVEGDGGVCSIKKTTLAEGWWTLFSHSSITYLYNVYYILESPKKIDFFLLIGTPFKYLKHRIDALDDDNCMCNYTLIEGDV